jgi:hypothetical protein
MDKSESSARPRIFQRRDGSWAAAVEVTPGIITIGRLVVVPDRNEYDRFEDALESARNELKAAVGAILEEQRRVAISDSEAREEIEVAFARYDYTVFHAFETLRQ